LIDDAGALTDQPLTHPVQGLQVELLDSLGGDKTSAIALASRKSFFCPFEKGRTYFAGISRASLPKPLSLRLR
jgi:hypothetical protein